MRWKILTHEQANIYQMDYMRTLQQTQAPAEVAPQPIPFKDLRLVYPLVHPDTGALRDVIINEVSLRKPNGSEKKAGLDKPIRSIAGLMPLIELPYPEVKEPQYEDHDSDTLRIEVEQLTWTPTLGVPPMPRSIIDELRNKYSVFRTRYDDAFIARKEAAAKRADEKRKALKTAARTPLDEINFAKRDGLRKINIEAAEGGAWKPLTSEIIEAMARIGLESEEKTGRKLPGRAREQFELIQQGFTDDPIPDEMVSEAADEDEKGLDEDDGDEESEWVDYPEEKAKP